MLPSKVNAQKSLKSRFLYIYLQISEKYVFFIQKYRQTKIVENQISFQN